MVMDMPNEGGWGVRCPVDIWFVRTETERRPTILLDMGSVDGHRGMGIHKVM